MLKCGRAVLYEDKKYLVEAALKNSLHQKIILDASNATSCSALNFRQNIA